MIEEGLSWDWLGKMARGEWKAGTECDVDVGEM